MIIILLPPPKKKAKDGGGGLVIESCPTLAISWTVACQAPLSVRFFRQEYWSGLPFPSPGDLPDPGIKPGLLHCRQTLYQLSYREDNTKDRTREKYGEILSVRS